MPTSPQSSTPSTPLQQITLTESDLANPSQFVSILNGNLLNLFQLVNSLIGFSGPININNHLNLNGNKITGVGQATSPSDVVTQSFAESNYGAAAIAPQIQALGKQVMQSYRRLNDNKQRENSSSFLNNLQSTSPTTNTSIVIFGAASGGFVPVTITGGLHQFMDRSQQPYAAYNDSLPLPTVYSISGSLIRSGGVVNGATTGSNTLVPHDTVAVINSGDPSFDGQFVLATASSPNFSYNQSAPDATASGGSISFGSVYYYLRYIGQSILTRVGPFAIDSWNNRLPGSYDASTLIAVVVLNGSGGDNVNSAAGGTPPAQANGVRLFGRL